MDSSLVEPSPADNEVSTHHLGEGCKLQDQIHEEQHVQSLFYPRKSSGGSHVGLLLQRLDRLLPGVTAVFQLIILGLQVL